MEKLRYWNDHLFPFANCSSIRALRCDLSCCVGCMMITLAIIAVIIVKPELLAFAVMSPVVVFIIYAGVMMDGF